MIYYVGGVNGAGKTLLLQGIVKQDNSFSHIKGSTLLMRGLGIKDGDYKTLRNLSTEFKNEKFGEMVKSMKSNSDINILIDAHFLNLINGNKYKVVGSWISSVDALILVEANAQDVIKRILKDSGRDRALFDDEVSQTKESVSLNIDRYMRDTRNEFNNLSKEYSLPNIVIKNEDGKINLAIKSFLEFHNKLINKNNKSIK